MDQQVTVVAIIKAASGKEEQVKQALLKLIEPTRKEKGCINYDMHQAQDDPTVFLFYENWESKTLLDEHLQKPHLKAFMDETEDLLAEPVDIRLWKMVSNPT